MTGPFVEGYCLKISVHIKSISPIFATQMRAITAGLAYVSIRRVYEWPGYCWDPNSSCPDPSGFLQIGSYDKDHCSCHLLSGLVNACVCVTVCVCINHLLVRAITRDQFKLGSPNLDQRCKRPQCFVFFGVFFWRGCVSNWSWPSRSILT